MKRLTFFIFPVAVWLSFLVSDVLAQSLTLEEIMRIALKVNPELQSLDNLVKSREGAVQQADVALNPSIGGSLGNRTQLFKLGQELEFPGKRSARTNAAAEEVEVARNEFRFGMLQLEREVTGLFYDLLWAQRNVELLQENVNINEKFLEAASYKFNQGFGSKLDVVKGQVEIAHAKRLLNSAEQEFLTTENKLRILLKIAFTQPLALKGDLTLSVVQAPQGLDSLLSTAYQSHPSLLLEQHRLKEAQYTVQLAELSSKPNFNLGLSGGIEDLERAATLSISIPLAIWDTKEGAKSEAQFQQKSVEYSLENIRTNISKQVTSAFQAYQAATQAAKLFEDTLLREAKEAAEMAKKAFETSGFRFLDLIDAQRTYLDARLEYLNSLRALRHAEIDLQTSTGIPIYGGQQ